MVDKQFYSNYASILARYGFIVVVPNRFRSLPGVEGFFPDTALIRDTLSHMMSEDDRPESPVFQLVNTRMMVLLGHSFGGAVGLAALAGECQPFLCEGELDLPVEVKGGAFYGTNRANLRGGVEPTPNHGFPIAILAGGEDGVSTPDETIETIARWSALFLRGEILGDPRAKRYLYRRGDRLDTQVEVTTIRF